MADHEFIYGEGFLGGDVVAGCTCGWEVDADDEADAVDKWESHCDVIFMMLDGEPYGGGDG
jgi:hypothetical protein